MIQISMNLFCSISDVHIRHPGDERYKALLSFMKSEEVLNSRRVIFLGDIFDLMVGNHQEYIKQYSCFFQLLGDLHSKGKEITYFEGNHDLHLEKLFRENVPFVNVEKEQMIVKENGKNYHFSHGDNFDISNLSYQRYKKVLNSSFCKKLAGGIVPFSFIELIGKNASKLSRKRSSAYSEHSTDELKERYRENILNSISSNIDVVVFGHSHILENNSVLENKQKTSLFNNGYFPQTKSFICATENSCSLIPLNI